MWNRSSRVSSDSIKNVLSYIISSLIGPTTELPVKVTGNIHSGFTAEFTPRDVGAHSITVEYNGHPVSGTPFVAKAYDAKRVFVGPLPKGSVGKSLQFMGEIYCSCSVM
jgi:filamin